MDGSPAHYQHLDKQVCCLLRLKNKSKKMIDKDYHGNQRFSGLPWTGNGSNTVIVYGEVIWHYYELREIFHNKQHQPAECSQHEALQTKNSVKHGEVHSVELNIMKGNNYHHFFFSCLWSKVFDWNLDTIGCSNFRQWSQNFIKTDFSTLQGVNIKFLLLS